MSLPFSRLSPKPALPQHPWRKRNCAVVPAVVARPRLALAVVCALTSVMQLATVARACAQAAFTIEGAMTYAETHAPSTRIARADLAEAEGQIKETTSIGIPKVNGNIDYTHFTEIPAQLLPDFISPAVYGVLTGEGVAGTNGPIVAPPPNDRFFPAQFGLKNSLQAGASASFLLFDATFFIALKGARLYRNLAVRTLEQAAYQTHVQVSRAYLATLIAQRNLETLERNVANLQRTLDETEAIYREGFAEKLSVDRIRLALGNLSAQRETLLQVEAISKNLLKFQMGYPVTEPIALSTTLDEALGQARVEALLADADFDVALRPEYATLQVADSLNAVDLQRIRAGYYPSLTGIASLSRQLQRNDLFDGAENGWIPSSYLGVSLDVPLFDGFNKRAQRERALARTEKTRVQIAEFEQGARLALANARASVLNARLAVRLREEAVALAEEIYAVAQTKFREGVGSSLEVNQAQSDLYAAQDAFTQALYDLAVAFTDYQDATGGL